MPHVYAIRYSNMPTAGGGPCSQTGINSSQKHRPRIFHRRVAGWRATENALSGSRGAVPQGPYAPHPATSAKYDRGQQLELFFPVQTDLQEQDNLLSEGSVRRRAAGSARAAGCAARAAVPGSGSARTCPAATARCGQSRPRDTVYGRPGSAASLRAVAGSRLRRPAALINLQDAQGH